MKTLTIVTSIFLALIIFTNCNAQTNEYPTHLFLGGFSRATANDTTLESWDYVSETEFAGKTVFISAESSILAETLRLFFLNGKLNYCATILEQDPENPQGEICFELKSYKDLVFTFENKNHDFPKRIIYNFSKYRTITARIEDDNKGYDLEYIRDYNIFKTYTFTGVFIKEQFVNKGGKPIDGVFDYFLQVQGIKYFIKLKNSDVKKDEIETLIGRQVKVSFSINEGLWDADDNTHQSRIGKFVRIIKILE